MKYTITVCGQAYATCTTLRVALDYAERHSLHGTEFPVQVILNGHHVATFVNGRLA